MFMLMLFYLIVNVLSTSQLKYLYLGKNDCNAVGNEAYLDKLNTGNITICSTSIPNVDQSKANGFAPSNITLLTIIVMEAETYSGLENLDGYFNVLIKKGYNEDKNVTFDTSTAPMIFSVRIDVLEVSEKIDIVLNVSSPYLSDPFINHLSLHGTSHAYLAGISENYLQFIVDNDLILDNFLVSYQKPIFFIGSGNVKIIDKNQILNNKIIFLNGTDLEYSGSSDYKISQLFYLCKETVKRTDVKDPKVHIEIVQLLLFDDSQMTEFFDADVDKLNIKSIGDIRKLVINSLSTIFLPIYNVDNTMIESAKKIDIDDRKLFSTNLKIPITCFSGKTNEGKDLKIIYQNINQNIVGFIFSEDLTDCEFDPAFLQYQYKKIESIHNKVKISPSYFEGLTELTNVNLECSDLTCHMDCLSGNGSGKLLDDNSNEIKPDYFIITNIANTTLSFEPMNNDVTQFNYIPIINTSISIEFKNYSGTEKAFYKFTYDIYAFSIIFDENVDVQFDCNLHLSQQLTVPEKSSLNNSLESGISICYGLTSIELKPISSTYSKKFNKITILDSSLYQNKHLIVNDLGSDSDEFNLITFIFPNENTEDYENPFKLSLFKISSCENLIIDFQSLLVEITENSIHIDKKTLDYNPKFTCLNRLMLGDINSINPDLFVFVRHQTRLQALSFSNLYLDGNFEIQKYSTDELKVSKTLFVKGMIITKDKSKVSARNMIFNPEGNSTLIPIITISKALYTSSIENFSTIAEIKSPKLIISNIDQDQDITIQNQQITLMKNNTPYKIDTTFHNKVILYIFNLDIEKKEFLSKGEGNKVNLKVEGSENSHKVIDFDILSSDKNKLNAPSKIQFVLHESISKGNPKFNGSFGYAFDENLLGEVVYKDGENGNEFTEIPSYFPMSQVKFEPFVDVEPEPDDESHSQEIQTEDLSSEQPSEIKSDETSDITTDDHPSEKPSGKKKLSGGAIAGIVIACVVAAVLITFGFVVLGKKTCCKDL